MIMYIPSVECDEAAKYLQDIEEDKSAQLCGSLDSVIQEWLAKHILSCAKCRRMTLEANTP